MKPQNIQKPHVIHVEGYVRFLSDTPSCASRRDQKFHNFAHADARSAGAQALAKNSQFPLSIARSAGARALTARPLRGGSRAGGTCCTRTMIFPPNAGSRPIANPRRDTCGQAAGGTSLHCPAAGAPAPTAVTGAYTKQLSLAKHSKGKELLSVTGPVAPPRLTGRLASPLSATAAALPLRSACAWRRRRRACRQHGPRRP